MKRILAASVIAVASLIGVAGSASATGQICSSVTVNVNGESVVSDDQCNDLPALPAPPALP